MFLVNSIGDKVYNLDKALSLCIIHDVGKVFIQILFVSRLGAATVRDFDTDKEVRAEFDRIIEALERGDKVYRIGD